MLRGAAACFEVLGDQPAVVEPLVGRSAWQVGKIRGHAKADVSKALLKKVLQHPATPPRHR
jgi:hypothetical protein